MQMNAKDPQKRKYRSGRRREQARETRRQILGSAREQFIRFGYAGATIDAIAENAGVSSETVFAAFGNKRTILAKLVQTLVGGDEQDLSLLERPGPQAVLHEQDPVAQIHLFAVDIAGILARIAPIFEVMRMAARTEADIAEMLEGILQERFRNLAAFVRNLAACAPLRDGLEEERAAETVGAITSPELFNLLTRDRGWTMEQYSRWLGETLIRLLLP